LQNVSPQSFQDLRDKLSEALEDELVICQFAKPAVFIGTSADEEAMVYANYCTKRKIPVIYTDGVHKSSSYHDSNEFRVFAVVRKDSDYPFLKSPWSEKLSQMQSLRIFAHIMVSTLSKFNVRATHQGDNLLVRLETNEVKIGRLSTRVSSHVRFSGHILLDWDIDTAEKAIVSPKHDMREHVKGLKELGYNVTFEQLRDSFIQAWQEVFSNV